MCAMLLEQGGGAGYSLLFRMICIAFVLLFATDMKVYCVLISWNVGFVRPQERAGLYPLQSGVVSQSRKRVKLMLIPQGKVGPVEVSSGCVLCISKKALHMIIH